MKKSLSFLLACLIILTMAITAYAGSVCTKEIQQSGKTYSGTFTETWSNFLHFNISMQRNGNKLVINQAPVETNTVIVRTRPGKVDTPTEMYLCYELIDTDSDIIKNAINETLEEYEGKEGYLVCNDTTKINGFPLEITLESDSDYKQLYIYLVVNENNTEFLFGYGSCKINDTEEQNDIPEDNKGTTTIDIYGVESSSIEDELNPNTGAEKIVIIVGAVSLVALIVAIILMKKLK